jgi:hypothetical protein
VTSTTRSIFHAVGVGARTAGDRVDDQYDRDVPNASMKLRRVGKCRRTERSSQRDASPKKDALHASGNARRELGYSAREHVSTLWCTQPRSRNALLAPSNLA